MESPATEAITVDPINFCTDEDTFCSICNKDFVSNGTYMAHCKKLHRSNFVHKCKFCAQPFQQPDVYILHANTQHIRDIQNTWHQCCVCFQFYPSARMLKIHTPNCNNANPGGSSDAAEGFEFTYSESQGQPGILETDGHHCSRCNTYFTSTVSLKTHCEKVHKLKIKIKCRFCNQTFPETHWYYKHANDQHASNIARTWQRCTFCNLRFPSNDVLKRHCDVSHSKKTTDFSAIRCSLCPKTFTNIASYKEHNEDEHSDIMESNGNQCSICQADFNSTQSLSRHAMKFHSKKVRFKCDYCPITFPNMSYKFRHCNTDHVDVVTKTWHKCPICSNYLPSAGSLKRHSERIHKHLNLQDLGNSNSKSFTCKSCSQEFSKQDDLKNHLKDQHQHWMDTDGSNCSKCDKEFPSINALKAHCLDEHGLRIRFKCTYCYESFADATNLYSHMNVDHLTAIAGTWTKCNICLMLFPTLDILVRHSERTHKRADSDKTKHYRCSLCPDYFSSQEDYSSHQTEIHPNYVETDGRTCTFCNKDFKTFHMLKSHCKKEHTVKPRYKCDYCCLTFANSGKFYKHINEDHVDHISDSWLKCNLCDQRLPTKDTLKRHCYVGHRDIDKATKKELTADESQQLPPRPLKIKCSVCAAVFNTKKEYQDHTQQEHPNIMETDGETCTICNIDFIATNALRKHVLATHLMRVRISCEFCEQTFIDNYGYYRHANRAHVSLVKESWYKCRNCPNYYPSTTKLRRHRANVHKKDPYDDRFFCSLCPEAFEDQVLYVQHKDKIHPDYLETDGQSCPLCDLDCQTMAVLKDHCAAVHNKKILVKCSFCTDTLPNRSVFYKHANEIHQNVIKNSWLQCKMCPLYYPTQEVMDDHLEKTQHLGNYKPGTSNAIKRAAPMEINPSPKRSRLGNWIPCDICQMVFPNGDNLESHQKQKHPELYQIIDCVFCSDKLTSKFEFHRHANMKHKSEVIKSWYLCPECTTYCYYASVRDLNKHTKLIHPEKEVEPSTECEFCSKILDSDGALLEHSNEEHKSEIMFVWYKCPECNFYFYSVDSLEMHVDLEHNTEVGFVEVHESFECRFCSQVFKVEPAYISHANEEHLSNVSKVWISCGRCRLFLPDDNSLLQHYKTRHGDKASGSAKNLPEDLVVKLEPQEYLRDSD